MAGMLKSFGGPNGMFSKMAKGQGVPNPATSNSAQGGMPDLSSIMSQMMGGGMPDLSSMMSQMMGGGMPDLSSMMSQMMGGGMPNLPSMMSQTMGGVPPTSNQNQQNNQKPSIKKMKK
jgi:hypothetical protein